MLRFQIQLLMQLSAWTDRFASPRDEQGQATAEYALVLLGAAALAGLFILWATKTDLLGKLLDTVFSKLLGHAL